MKNFKDKARVICHSLKMNTLSGVDPDKMTDFSSRIKSLPTPERIASMNHGEILDLSNQVEKLIFDIDNARNSRTFDYAIKHRIDKGIPPRMQPVLASENSNWLQKSLHSEV